MLAEADIQMGLKQPHAIPLLPHAFIFHLDCVEAFIQSLVIHLSPFMFSLPFFFLSPCLDPLVEDVNANPNKRQRQPALLGDHPPEYGKTLVAPEDQECAQNLYTSNYCSYDVSFSQ